MHRYDVPPTVRPIGPREAGLCAPYGQALPGTRTDASYLIELGRRRGEVAKELR